MATTGGGTYLDVQSGTIYSSLSAATTTTYTGSACTDATVWYYPAGGSHGSYDYGSWVRVTEIREEPEHHRDEVLEELFKWEG